MSIVFFTNCQGKFIYNYLKHIDFFKSYNVVFTENYNIDIKVIQDCDIFIYQPVNNYTINTNNSLLYLLKESCIKICIPSIQVDMWPIYEDKSDDMSIGYYGGDIINNYRKIGYDLNIILNMYDTGKLCFNLYNRLHNSLEYLKHKEDTYCNINVSDFILKNYKKYRLFNNQSEPNGIISSYIAKEICKLLKVDFPDINIYSQQNINCTLSLASLPDSIYMKADLDLRYIGNNISDASKTYYRELIIKIFNEPSFVKYMYKPKKQFITFSAGDPNYYAAGIRLINQANNIAIFDKIKLYTDEDLKNDNNFWPIHSRFIEKNKRGYGYWIWKSYIIKKTMEEMNDGDMLLYLDCGCEIDILKREQIMKFFNYVKQDYIIGSQHGRERQYNKMDLILHLDMLYDKYLNTDQRQAGAVMYLVCNKTRKFVNQWYETCCNYHLIDDSVSIHTNLESIIEHRHDQSVFSLLTKKYNIFSKRYLPNCISYCRQRSGNSDLQVYNFNGQAEQDKFVLNILKYRQSGYFLEIGSSHPININNTYILEKAYNWKGIMVDDSIEWLENYKIYRPNSIYVIHDATNIDYINLFQDINAPLNIDYLQIDLESTNGSTLKTLENLDNKVMDTYKFAVVTFKHDCKAELCHLPIVQMTRTKSREIFKKRGYICVFEDIHNISPESVYEDWYVHPELVDIEYIANLKEKNMNKYVANSITGKSINWQSINY